uniref:Uncharacterized protein n=1 Tax=Vespula pensylvanica TaxID=30213 RepID=A0A834PCJ6_VESPE|nr:hypothetical protein H0235_003699 [Vespula pensylvanica]
MLRPREQEDGGIDVSRTKERTCKKSSSIQYEKEDWGLEKKSRRTGTDRFVGLLHLIYGGGSKSIYVRIDSYVARIVSTRRYDLSLKSPRLELKGLESNMGYLIKVSLVSSNETFVWTLYQVHEIITSLGNV